MKVSNVLDRHGLARWDVGNGGYGILVLIKEFQATGFI